MTCLYGGTLSAARRRVSRTEIGRKGGLGKMDLNRRKRGRKRGKRR